jgi:hypothetical protein
MPSMMLRCIAWCLATAGAFLLMTPPAADVILVVDQPLRWEFPEQSFGRAEIMDFLVPQEITRSFLSRKIASSTSSPTRSPQRP